MVDEKDLYKFRCKIKNDKARPGEDMVIPLGFLGKEMVMKQRVLSGLFIIVVFFLMNGCAVKVTPILSTSLGITAFDNMKKIELHNTSLGLYFDPKVKELKVDQKIKVGEFTFPIGSAFSVKLIKALAYHFRTIHLIDQPDYREEAPFDAIMIVTLQDIDMKMGVKSGFSTVSTESYIRISIRAEIKDKLEKKTVWVGATQVKETGSHQEYGQMTYQEAGRGFASAIDIGIDKAIGDLMDHMSRSDNLAKYFDIWEKGHREGKGK